MVMGIIILGEAMFNELLILDNKSMIAMLVWCNLSLFILLLGYRLTRDEILEKRVIALFAYGKLAQGLSWFLLFNRATIPLFWSRFVGNNLIFIGFLLESLVMMSMTEFSFKKSLLIQMTITFLGAMVFNLMPRGTADHWYVVVATAISFLIYLVPTLFYVLEKTGSRFKRFLGYNYVLFLCAMIIRGVTSVFDVETQLFDNNYAHSLSFVTLTLLTVVSGPGFLLLLKEKADKELMKLATLDSLTRIPNRRYFMEHAEEILNEHRKRNLPISFAFVDIDKFKLVNDEYGHHFGDEVLVHLAHNLNDSVRGSDLICRYGGEEFLMLLAETDESGGQTVIHHLQEKISKARLSLPDFKYSISIGLYSTVPINDSLTECIEKSDQAMYQAKEEGRNRLVVYRE